MAGIDSTVIFEILRNLSGNLRTLRKHTKYRAERQDTRIYEDLCLQFSSAYKFTPYYFFRGQNTTPPIIWWPKTEDWLEFVLNAEEAEDPRLQIIQDEEEIRKQPFHAETRYTFESQVYRVLLNYAQRHPSPMDCIMQVCKNLRVPERDLLLLQQKESLEELIYALVDTASKRPKGEVTQRYLAENGVQQVPADTGGGGSSAADGGWAGSCGQGKAVYLMTVAELKKAGIPPAQIAEQIVENDRNLYPVAQENEGTAEQWRTFMEGAPECWRFLYDRAAKKIVGNWSFTLLMPEQRELAVEGRLLERDLAMNNTASVFVPGVYSLFLLNFSVNQDYLESRYSIELLNALWQQLAHLAQLHVYFREILVNIFIPAHEGYFKTLGFEFVSPNAVSGTIYRLGMIPFPKTIHCPQLRVLYEDRFSWI